MIGKRETGEQGSRKRHKVAESVDYRKPALEIRRDPERSVLVKREYSEPVDLGRLEKLRLAENVLKQNLEPEAFQSQQQQVNKLWQKRNTLKGCISVSYQFSDSGRCEYGRVYPMHQLSLGELCGELRSYLLWDLWIPLDFTNAHPTIILSVLTAHEQECPALKRYCADREQILQEVMKVYHVERSCAKQLFIRLLYLGTFSRWAIDCNISQAMAEETEFVREFALEMKTNAKFICDSNEELRSSLKPNPRSIAKAEQEKKKRSPGRPRKIQPLQETEECQVSDDQVVSFWCQEHERVCLRVLFDFLAERGILSKENPQCMLRYDGIDILQSSWERVPNKDEFLKDAETAVLSATGIPLQLTTKPYSRSTLEQQIEEESSLEKVIPTKGKHSLDLDTLKSLQVYPRMKAYFERFVAKIINNSNFAWILYHSQTKTYVPVLRNEAELTTSFKHIKIQTIDDKGEDVEEQFIAKWLNDPDMRVCDEVVFSPTNQDCCTLAANSRNAFNLFQGFSVSNKRDRQLQFPVADYLRAFHYIGLQFCENDPPSYQLFIDRLASLVQRPSRRFPFAFVFQDKPQGIGTDTWFSAFGRLLGERHFKSSSNINDFLGKHAEGIENKLLVVMNELTFSDSSSHQSRLKDLITCERTTIDAKHQRPIEVEVFALLVFVSNNSNAIHFDNVDNERRFIVWRPTGHALHAIKTDLWAFLRDKLFGSTDFLVALYKYLIGVDLNGVDMIEARNVTMSDSYFLASEKNSPLDAKFFTDFLRKLFSGEKKSLQEDFKLGVPNMICVAPRNPWEPPSIQSYDTSLEIKASHLHSLYREFVSDVIGGTSKRGDFGKLLIESRYGGVIQSVKNCEEMYRFNPRSLWSFLIQKKWVEEAVKKNTHDYSEQREQMLKRVDPLFVELSKLGKEAKTSDLVSEPLQEWFNN